MAGDGKSKIRFGEVVFWNLLPAVAWVGKQTFWQRELPRLVFVSGDSGIDRAEVWKEDSKKMGSGALDDLAFP